MRPADAPKVDDGPVKVGLSQLILYAAFWRRLYNVLQVILGYLDLCLVPKASAGSGLTDLKQDSGGHSERVWLHSVFYKDMQEGRIILVITHALTSGNRRTFRFWRSGRMLSRRASLLEI